MATLFIIIGFLVLITVSTFTFGYIAYILDRRFSSGTDRKMQVLLVAGVLLLSTIRANASASFNFGYVVGTIIVYFLITSVMVLITQKLYKYLKKPIGNRSVLFFLFGLSLYILSQAGSSH